MSDPNHPQHRSDAYQRLRELVYASEHIDPDYVLSKLGQVGALLVSCGHLLLSAGHVCGVCRFLLVASGV
jgi:hypothetical protein